MLAAVYLEFLMNLGLYIVAPILICTILWSQLKVRPSKKIIWGVSGWVIAWIGWKVIGYVDTGWGELLEKVLGYIWQSGLLFFIGLLVLDLWVLVVLSSPSS